MHRYRVTGIQISPRWMRVYFQDQRSRVPRTQMLQLPWGLIADRWPEVAQATDRVFLERIKAEDEKAQQPLPLESWE